MTDGSKSGPAQKATRSSTKTAKTTKKTRRPNLASRFRGRMRRVSDRILASDTGWSVALVLVALVLLSSQRWARDFEPLSLGEVAPRDIVVREELTVIDQQGTLDSKQKARLEQPDVYVYDTTRGESLASDMSIAFARSREEASPPAESGDVPAELPPIPPSVQAILDASDDAPKIEGAVMDAVRKAMAGPIVGNKSLLEREDALILMRRPGGREERLETYGGIRDVDHARDVLEQELGQSIELSPSQRRVLIEFAASFLDANVHLDAAETEARRRRAAEQASPVMVKLSRGHILIRKGERITADALARLEAARGAATQPFGFPEFLGLVLLCGSIAFFLLRYCRYHQRNFKKVRHLHALLALLLMMTMLLTRALQWLASEVTDNLAYPFNDPDSYLFLAPVAAGAILVALLANGRIATVYAAFSALLFGALCDSGFYLMAWGFLVQLTGVYAVTSYRERAALLRAGLVVGAAGAVAALALGVLEGSAASLGATLFPAAVAFIGGAIGIGLLVSFTLPPLETLFEVLTDIRLLELSNVNNPLLSQLAVHAPGSYNHSLVVGTLAEEGARAIGANSLFCRVAAFYHDIGKIKHPEYYVENQRGMNPHDRLAPSMSALIIASHVKDGILLARDAGLPEPIVDIIPQHHGTKRMTYFYEKARKQSDPAMGPVKEEDFRYPGPKPQTREAAIFMLADAVEAAARTIDDPSPNRLKEMIRKITSSIVLDGQFDQCDLTFSDLDKIQSAFLRLLGSMYHHRVDYPGFDFNKTRSQSEVVDRKLARST